MHAARIHAADRAVLRLTFGLGLSVLVAYGLGVALPYLVCVLAVIVLCKPGPPLPLLKGLIGAGLIALLVAAGGIMVPLLRHYALSGLLLTATILFSVFFIGLTKGGGLTMILVIAFTLIPVAGTADPALVGALSGTIAIGVITGTLADAIAHVLFPPPSGAAPVQAAAPNLSHETAGWIATRAVLIVMPVFILALTNPSLYLAAIMKTVALGQQAGDTTARSAGRELIGSTLMGALLALVAWLGLSLLPSLWMLMLWVMVIALWAGSGLFRTRRTALSPSFWSNALITSLILLGPAIEDSANGKSVLEASAVRTGLYLVVAFYAWAMVWLFERWRALRSARMERGLLR